MTVDINQWLILLTKIDNINFIMKSHVFSGKLNIINSYSYAGLNVNI